MAKRVGPFGGVGKYQWDDKPQKGVKQIEVSYGSVVNSIKFLYDNGEDSLWTLKHGGNGKETATVTLNYPKEYLIWISGYTSNTSATAVVQSISFTTNISEVYGPYGTEVGDPFTTRDVWGIVNGFFGSNSDTQISSIGVYLGPFPVGPYGGADGKPWDDGYFTAIKQVFITWDDTAIGSIQTEYDSNGSSIMSLVHGETKRNAATIKLDFPNEHILRFSGYLSSADKSLRSLSFQTNQRSFGPYGVEDGERFSSPPLRGNTVGFFGRSSLYIDALGAYNL